MTARNVLCLNVYEDPAHSWLEVPMALLEELNITADITPFSYRHNDQAYLEEDLDMTTFLNAINQSEQYTLEFFSHYHDSSPVRQFASYRV